MDRAVNQHFYPIDTDIILYFGSKEHHTGNRVTVGGADNCQLWREAILPFYLAPTETHDQAECY
jgi:hypothetical protein